jgi:Domain of unknown function (DUF6265)
MNSGHNRKWLLVASAAMGMLALGASPAQRSVGAGTHAITPAQSPQPAAGSAQAPSPGQRPASSTTAPNAAPAQQKPTLADFAWLEGRWLGTWGPRSAEQCWSSPKAGMMVGTFRLVENEKTLVIEMFTLVEKPDGINFYFRHFTPDMVAWEKGDATLLNLVGVEGQRATFENPVNGQPKRSIFVRVDADTFIARSEIVPDSGDTQVIEITYHRQKAAAAAPPAGAKASAGSGAHR